MPSAAEILAGLGAIANERMAVAVGWHVALAAAVAGVLVGWRPSLRTARVGLAVLAGSVAAWAWVYANPFNGIAFGLLALLLLAGAFRGTGGSAAAATSAARWLGAVLIGFGWVYPHFLVSQPLLAYVIAAPTGLIPCPTLSVLTGFALLSRDLIPRSMALTLAGYGVFYSLFGALRLGVWLDAGLLIGAVALMATAWRSDYRGSGSNT
jgi:hypothetical protein